MTLLDYCSCGIRPFYLPHDENDMTDKPQPTWTAVASLIAQCTIPLLLVAVGFVGSQVLENKDAITEIRSTRYTAEQAHKDQREQMAMFDSIRTGMWNLEKNLPDMARVGLIESRLSALEDKIDQLRKDVKGE